MTNEKAYDDIVTYLANGCYNGNNSLCFDTLLSAQDALSKQIPKEPVAYDTIPEGNTDVHTYYYGCPCCRTILESWNFRYGICRCGQKIKSLSSL